MADLVISIFEIIQIADLVLSVFCLFTVRLPIWLYHRHWILSRGCLYLVCLIVIHTDTASPFPTPTTNHIPNVILSYSWLVTRLNHLRVKLSQW